MKLGWSHVDKSRQYKGPEAGFYQPAREMGELDLFRVAPMEYVEREEEENIGPHHALYSTKKVVFSLQIS